MVESVLPFVARKDRFILLLVGTGHVGAAYKWNEGYMPYGNDKTNRFLSKINNRLRKYPFSSISL